MAQEKGGFHSKPRQPNGKYCWWRRRKRTYRKGGGKNSFSKKLGEVERLIAVPEGREQKVFGEGRAGGTGKG